MESETRLLTLVALPLFCLYRKSQVTSTVSTLVERVDSLTVAEQDPTVQVEELISLEKLIYALEKGAKSTGTFLEKNTTVKLLHMYQAILAGNKA
jgi:hypothetical protein